MIRAAQAREADLLREIVHAAYQRYTARIGKPPAPMLDDYARRIADRQAWALEVDGRIVGVLILEDRDGDLLLDNVAVHPDVQGAGHGRTLIGFAEAEARRRGHRTVRLYTHALMTENQALYRRVGFVETSRVTEHGFDRIYMTKSLA